MSKTLLEGLRDLANLLEDPTIKALGELPWDGGTSISLVFFQDKVTAKQMRVIKQHCGPLEFKEDGDNKDARGSTKVGPKQINLHVTVYNAMLCSPMAIGDDGITAEQMKTVSDRIQAGEIKLIECLQSSYADECVTPGCEKASGYGTQCSDCIQEQQALEHEF